MAWNRNVIKILKYMHNLFYIHSYELKINTIWLMKVCKEGRVKVTGNLQSVLRLSCHFVPCLEPFSKWQKTTNCGIDSYLSAGRDQYDLKHFLPHLNSTHSTLTSAGNQDQWWPCFFCGFTPWLSCTLNMLQCN